jgi:hypothetical protein
MNLKNLAELSSMPVHPSASSFRSALSRLIIDSHSIINLARVMTFGCLKLDVRPFVYAILPFIFNARVALERLVPSLVMILCEKLAQELEDHIKCVGAVVGRFFFFICDLILLIYT